MKFIYKKTNESILSFCCEAIAFDRLSPPRELIDNAMNSLGQFNAFELYCKIVFALSFCAIVQSHIDEKISFAIAQSSLFSRTLVDCMMRRCTSQFSDTKYILHAVPVRTEFEMWNQLKTAERTHIFAVRHAKAVAMKWINSIAKEYLVCKSNWDAYCNYLGNARFN